MNALHTADALACWLTEAPATWSWCWDAEGRKPTFRPAADAVTRTAAPATATAPRANPRTLRWRSLARLVITRNYRNEPGPRSSPPTSRFCKAQRSIFAGMELPPSSGWSGKHAVELYVRTYTTMLQCTRED